MNKTDNVKDQVWKQKQARMYCRSGTDGRCCTDASRCFVFVQHFVAWNNVTETV